MPSNAFDRWRELASVSTNGDNVQVHGLFTRVQNLADLEFLRFFLTDGTLIAENGSWTGILRGSSGLLRGHDVGTDFRTTGRRK